MCCRNPALTIAHGNRRRPFAKPASSNRLWVLANDAPIDRRPSAPVVAAVGRDSMHEWTRVVVSLCLPDSSHVRVVALHDIGVLKVLLVRVDVERGGPLRELHEIKNY